MPPSHETRWFVAIALLAMCVAGWLCLYVSSGVHHATALNGPRLLNLRQEWLQDGSPEPPPLQKYVARWTDPERFFIWTNAYTIDGQTFQSLLGMNDARFEGKGVLVVSRTGD